MRNNTTNNSTIFSYYESNPFFRWILGKGKYPIWRFIGILAFWYLLISIVCWIDGTLFLEGIHKGLIEDFVMYVLIIILIFMVKALLNMFIKINELFDTSENSMGLNQVFTNVKFRKKIFEKYKKQIIDIISLKDKSKKKYYWLIILIWFFIFYLFQIHIPVFLPQPIKAWAVWPQEYLFTYYIACLWCYFTFGIILGNITWYSLASAFLIFRYVYKLTKREAIKVIPLSPDGRGGLACLGKMSFAITLILIPGMIFSVTWIVAFGIDLPAMIGLPIYFIILISLFFIPLYSVHKAMNNAKMVEMMHLSKAFRIRYESFASSLSKNVDDEETHNVVRDTLEELSRLEQLYRRAESMPIWPFDAGTLKQFITLIIIPLIIFLIQLLTKNAITKFIEELIN